MSPSTPSSPCSPAAMPGRTVIQWDKEDVETLSLFKVDLLGLGMLSQLQRCFELLRRHPALDGGAARRE